MLKQLVSSLTYPESKLGRKYWNKVYKEVYKIAGTTNVPIDTFNKVWIVPENAKVYENGNVALVHQAKLEVMQEEDYLAAKENKIVKEDSRTDKAGQIGQVSAGVMKEIIIPEVEKEVNNGRNFARLRQMYNSFVLAAWFKEKLKDSIFQYYIDQGKIEGIDLEDKDVKEKVYNLYVKAYKEGVYNYIKKDYDAASRQYLRRKYYSGGITGFTAQGVERESSSPARMKADVDIEKCRGWEVDLDPIVGAMHEAVERKEISYLQKEKVTITSGGQKQMVRQNNSS